MSRGASASKAWQLSGWDVLLLLITWLHVLITPYTKVEESFNVQAVHDVLYHQLDYSKYDHLMFPGVVPRTFIGAFALAAIASPIAFAFHVLGIPKLATLYAVRMALGAVVIAAMARLRWQAAVKFGNGVGAAFALLTATQFHLVFYSSRPLPNVFALALVTLAYSYLLQGRPRPTLRLLVFAMVVFRCDMALLLGPIGLAILLSGALSFWSSFCCCALTAILSLALTVAVDSPMWGRGVLWPEGQVLWFNTVLNRSSEWGVSPYHWYFTSALPRALLAALPLSVMGAVLERRIRLLCAAVLLFLILYSKLPHKELRFIFPALPALNLSAACALHRMWINRNKSTSWRLMLTLTTLALLGSCAASVVFAAASHGNYPGGAAIHLLHQQHEQVAGAEKVKEPFVHISVLPAMTGISRFCELGHPWRYSKEEGIALADLALRNFTHLISGEPLVPGFKRLAGVEGFARVHFNAKSFPPLELVKEPRVHLHIKEEASV